jgi:hypothetical protein
MPDNENMGSDDNTLRDSEVALMDAIKTVFEVIIAKGISSPDTLASILSKQSESYPQATMPRAVFVMDSLRDFVNDPQRKELREQLRQMLQTPPKGSA